MTEIQSFCERVEKATERLGQAEEQRRVQSDQLVDLIEDVEQGLSRKQTQIDTLQQEIAGQAETIAGLEQTKTDLLGMMDLLLQALEQDDGTRLHEAMGELGTRMSALMGEGESQAPAPDAASEASEEVVTEAAPEVEAAPEPDTSEAAPEPDTIETSPEPEPIEAVSEPETSEPEPDTSEAAPEPDTSEASPEPEASEPETPPEDESEAPPSVAAEEEPAATEDTAAPEDTTTPNADQQSALGPKEIENLLAGIEADAASGKPSTVRKIIQRVSALAEELEDTKLEDAKPEESEAAETKSEEPDPAEAPAAETAVGA